MEERFGAALDVEPAAARGAPGNASDGLYAFVVLACGITWAASLPVALSWLRGTQPPAYAIALAGLSAFGPTIAAWVMARRNGRLREVFGRFRAPAPWLLLAAGAPWALHSLARLLEVAAGGSVERWVWAPETSEQVAALFVFSLGEEFGWRGFAHPVLLRRHGPVLGSLILGAIWGVWHLTYQVTPEGVSSAAAFAATIVELMLWSLVVAWFYERTRRSMGVAIALHAGAHLDNSARIPAEADRLHAFAFLVLFVAAVLAARSLLAARRRTLRARTGD